MSLPPLDPPLASPPLPAVAHPLRGRAWSLRLLDVMQREPVLFVTLGYLCISFTGMWSNYWYYAGFDVPVLQYMQASDFIVAGLRDPRHLLILFAGMLLSWLVSFADLLRKRDPERVQQLRGRWWGRVVFLDSRWFRWPGIAPETGLVVGFVWVAVVMLYINVRDAAAAVRAGGGDVVAVTLAGAAATLPGDIRLLGTSSAFVFLWWPQEQRAEVVPIQAIARIASAPAAPARAAPPPPAAAEPPAPLPPAGPAR